MEKLWHFIEKFEIGTGNPAISLCGITSSDNPLLIGANSIGLVTCRECKRIYRETRGKEDGLDSSEISFRVTKVSGELYGYEWLAGGQWFRSHSFGVVNGIFSGDGLIRQQWTTFTDVSKNRIYVGDVISAGDTSNKAAGYIGTVVFDAGCFSLLITKTNNPAYNISSKPPLYDFCNLKIIKPIKEVVKNKELCIKQDCENKAVHDGYCAAHCSCLT